MSSPYEGSLIRLRAREMSDEPAFHRWVNDPEVNEYLSMRYPFSHAMERSYIASTAELAYTGATFSLETLDGRLIGNADIRVGSPEDRCASLGITIGEKDCWNRGYGTDTMRTLCRVGFQVLNLNRIELEVYAGNDRARHVYEKVGFRHEGTHRHAHFRFGRYVDSHQMGILRDEFVDLPPKATS